MTLRSLRPDWTPLAACRDTDPREFFVTDPLAQQAVVDRWCVGCAVRDRCRAEATSRRITDVIGAWGATEDDNRRLFTQQRQETIRAS